MLTDNALVTDITEKLGISKLALASLLGINSGILTRIASGSRQLPLKAIAAMATTHAIIANLPAMAPPTPTHDALSENQEKAAWCDVQLLPLQKQLQQTQTNYLQAATLLAFVKKYAANTTPQTPKQQRWIAGQTHLAEKKMKNNGWHVQQQLQLKIVLLQTEAHFYRMQAEPVL